MPQIKFGKLTKAQLSYIEGLIGKIDNPMTFKFQVLPRLIGRPIDFISQLTKVESSKVIQYLLKELGEI